MGVSTTYGLKSLFFFLLTASWIGIIAFDDIRLFPSVAALIILATILFVPLIRINNEGLRLRTLNPFRAGVSIKFSELERMHIQAGDFRFRMIFYMKDGSKIVTNNHLRYDDMEGVFNRLSELGVDVTSSGVRALEWKR